MRMVPGQAASLALIGEERAVRECARKVVQQLPCAGRRAHISLTDMAAQTRTPLPDGG